MNPLRLFGLILLILGLLSFVVPIPRHEDHTVKVGDTKVGVQTETSQRLPPYIGIIMLIGGVVSVAAPGTKS